MRGRSVISRRYGQIPEPVQESSAWNAVTSAPGLQEKFDDARKEVETTWLASAEYALASDEVTLAVLPMAELLSERRLDKLRGRATRSSFHETEAPVARLFQEAAHSSGPRANRSRTTACSLCAEARVSRALDGEWFPNVRQGAKGREGEGLARWRSHHWAAAADRWRGAALNEL